MRLEGDAFVDAAEVQQRGEWCGTDQVTRFYNILYLLALIYILLSVLLTWAIYRVVRILSRSKVATRRKNDTRKGHLLVVVGSGGHTAEMISILENLGPQYLNSRFDQRTWVVSSGDGFSAERAKGLEEQLRMHTNMHAMQSLDGGTEGDTEARYDIVTVRRARNVRQSLATTPLSALQCLWDCVCLLRGMHRNQSVYSRQLRRYPDLILTNGPGTGVIVVVAALLLQFCGIAPVNPAAEVGGAMRSVYIESWARVKTLSLSGKILRFVVSRFLVQWQGLADVDLTKIAKHEACSGTDQKQSEVVVMPRASVNIGRTIEYVGPVVT